PLPTLTLPASTTGQITLRVTATAIEDEDTQASTSTDLVVTIVNTAPILDPRFKPNLGPITTSGGVRISQYLQGTGRAGGVSDPDSGGSRGIALVGLRGTRGGMFEFRVGGGPWRRVDVSRLRSDRALLLSGNDRMRFRPTTSSGRVQLQYRAWDQTTGRAGGLANTTQAGGQSAFSQAVGAARMTTRSSSSAAAAAYLAVVEPVVNRSNPALVDAFFSEA
ncbi:MAG: hypothetical protein ACRDD1_01205, partial [Planctomycetia bacterium]